MRSHICDVTKTEPATHALIVSLVSLVKLDTSGSYETGEDPEHQIVLDAGTSVAERVKAGDLFGLGQLVPRKDRPKTAEAPKRSSRRGADPAAISGAASTLSGNE